MYYAAVNEKGFANTWDVYAFHDRKSRDAFVDNHPGLVRVIRRREATGYAANWSMVHNRRTEPTPFTGEFWGIVDHDREIPGYAGDLEVCQPGDDDRSFVTRFYN